MKESTTFTTSRPLYFLHFQKEMTSVNICTNVHMNFFEISCVVHVQCGEMKILMLIKFENEVRVYPTLKFYGEHRHPNKITRIKCKRVEKKSTKNIVVSLSERNNNEVHKQKRREEFNIQIFLSSFIISIGITHVIACNRHIAV